MDKNQLRDEIIQNLIYPRKLPYAVFLEEISMAEFMLMASVITYENDTGTHAVVNELASRLEVTVPAVSRSLKKLEEKGLVKRICNEECRRNTFVKILPKGKELFEYNRNTVEYMVDKLVSSLTPEEIEASIQFNKKVATIMDKEYRAFVANKFKDNN